MPASRRQPSTIDTQRVTKRDQRQEAKNKTQASKSSRGKFNSGLNVEAVFGAISQLLETFTSQLLDRTGVNMSLLLRTIYRNLDDDLVGILSEPQNVEALNNYLAEKNEEIQSSSSTAQETVNTPTQETPSQTTEPVIAETVTREAEPIVTEKEGDVTETIESSTSTKPLETIVQQGEVTEKILPPVQTFGETKVTETSDSTSKDETEVKSVDLSKFTNTQKLCALGDAKEEDLDILNVAHDFIGELMQDVWKLGNSIKAIRSDQEARYDDFEDNVQDNDEDDYEYNLYRYMYRQQKEVMEEREQALNEIIEKREKLASKKSPVKGELPGVVGERMKATGATKPEGMIPSREPAKDLIKNIQEDFAKNIVRNVVTVAQRGVSGMAPKTIATGGAESEVPESRSLKTLSLPPIMGVGESKSVINPSPTVDRSQLLIPKSEALSGATPKVEPGAVAIQGTKAQEPVKKLTIRQRILKFVSRFLPKRKKAIKKPRKLPLRQRISKAFGRLRKKLTPGFLKKKPEGAAKKEEPPVVKKFFIFNNTFNTTNIVMYPKNSMDASKTGLGKPAEDQSSKGSELSDRLKGNITPPGTPVQDRENVDKRIDITKSAESAKPATDVSGSGKSPADVQTPKAPVDKPKELHATEETGKPMKDPRERETAWIEKLQGKKKSFLSGVISKLKGAFEKIKFLVKAPLLKLFSRKPKKERKPLNLSKLVPEKIKTRFRTTTKIVVERIQRPVDRVKEALPKLKENVSTKVRGKALDIGKDLAGLREKLPDFKGEFAKFKEKLPDVKGGMDKFRQKLPNLKEKLPDVREKLSRVRDKIQNVKETISKLKPKLPDIKSKISQYREKVPKVQIGKLKDTLSAVKKSPTTQRALGGLRLAANKFLPSPIQAKKSEQRVARSRSRQMAPRRRPGARRVGVSQAPRRPRNVAKPVVQPKVSEKKPDLPKSSRLSRLVSSVRSKLPKIKAPETKEPTSDKPKTPKISATKSGLAFILSNWVSKAPKKDSQKVQNPVTPKVPKATKKPALEATPKGPAPKKDLVSILRSQLSQAKNIKGRQDAQNKSMSKKKPKGVSTKSLSGPKVKPGPTPKPKRTRSRKALATSAKAAKMDPNEAYRRNISDGVAWLNETLFNGKIASTNLALPNNLIGQTLSKIMNATSKVAKKTEESINKVEDAINNPNSGDSLFTRIKNGLIKVAIVALGTILVIGLVRKHFGGFFPKGADGKRFHGIKILGITLPNFKDMKMLATGMYKSLKLIIKKVWSFGKLLFQKKTWTTLYTVTKWVVGFVLGLKTGKIALLALKAAAGWLGGLIGLPPDVTANILQVVIAQITAFKLLISDWLGIGKGSKESGLTVDNWKKKAEKKLLAKKESFEIGATQKSVKKISDAAKKVRTLVPMEDILPKEMTPGGVDPNSLPKAIIPDMGVVANYNKAAQTEQTISKKDKQVIEAKKNAMSEATKSGADLDKRLAAAGQTDYDKLPEGKKKSVFITPGFLGLQKTAYAEIAKLKKARERVKDDFVPQNWYNRQADVSDWIDTSTGTWNPKYVYADKNEQATLSVMSTTPFEPISDSPTFKIAEPYKQQDYGIMPLTAMIPATGQKFTADLYEWERNRLDVGISAWQNILNAAWMYGYNSPSYKTFLNNQIKRWADISLFPNYGARMSTKQMIDAWNKYQVQKDQEKRAQEQAKIAEQLKKNQLPAEEQKPGVPDRMSDTVTNKGAEKAKAKTSGGKGLDSSLNVTETAAKNVPVVGTKPNKPEDKPKEPVEAPKPITYANEFIETTLKSSPWKELTSQKPKDIMKALNLSTWFSKKPPTFPGSKREKIWQEGAGQIAYNIMTELGFVYDRSVWNNPEFIKVRPAAISAFADSVNMYINGFLQSYRLHLQHLMKTANDHPTDEYQSAIMKTAQKTITEFGEKNKFESLMKFVAANYSLKDYHLVVRDKEGKIVKETGKELRNFEIPNNIYESDPALWDTVIEGMDGPQEGDKAGWSELRKARNKIKGGIKWIQKEDKRLKKSMAEVVKRQELATTLLTVTLADTNAAIEKIKTRVKKAKKDIRNYFFRQSLLYRGPAMAAHALIKGAKNVIKGAKDTIGIVGEKVEGAFGSLFKRGSKFRDAFNKKLGGIKGKIKGDLKSFVNKVQLREKYLKAKSESEKAMQENRHIKHVGKVVDTAKKGASFLKKAITKGTKTNFKLFGLFYKKKADDSQLEMQTQEIAKELVPDGDEIANARIKTIVKMAEDRKQAESRERESLMGYWANLKRQWEDKISEESMKELKGTTLKLSTNILDYLGMVRELPNGNTIVNTQTIVPQNKVMELLHDITF